MINDIAKKLLELVRRDMLDHFPGGDEIKPQRRTIPKDRKGLSDVSGKEILSGQMLPIRAPMPKRVIGPFQPNSLPTKRLEISHQLPARTAQVHEGLGTAALALLDQRQG